MSKSRTIPRLLLFLLAASAAAGSSRAQEPQEPQVPQTPEGVTKPKPAARGIPGLNESQEEETNNNWQPDNAPVTGLQNPTLGTQQLAHSYWVPGVEYGSTIQSQPLGQQASTGWYANNYVGGDLSLAEAWGRSQLGLNYSVGGFFTSNSLESNGWYQQLSLADSITLNRWQIQFYDVFSYIPESDFGFFGASGLALPGIGGSLGPSLPGLSPAILPNQSIYSAIGPRYGNAFAAQVTYLLSRRGSVTVGGSYGLLRFTQAGNIDDDMAVANVGYNYALNKTDSIGAFYQFAGYHYSGEPQAIGTHSVNFVYAKKVTQRVALKLYGGPQFSFYRVPISNQTENTNVSAGATVTYALGQRGSLSAAYFHGVTGGSGILLGASTDQATAGFSHQFGIAWTGSFNFGYSRNGSLGTVAGAPSPTFNDWFVGGGVSRPFGRNVNFSVNYTARIEHSNATCIGTGCNSDYTQNMVSVSLQWHARPFVLR